MKFCLKCFLLIFFFIHFHVLTEVITYVAMYARLHQKYINHSMYTHTLIHAVLYSSSQTIIFISTTAIHVYIYIFFLTRVYLLCI